MKRRTFELTIMIILALLIVGIGIRLFVKPIDRMPVISFSNFGYEDSNMYTQSSSGSARNISNLEVNWVSGYVEIVSYDGKEVFFEEKSDAPIEDKNQMCYWQDGDTLKIQFSSPGIHKSINYHKQLYIYIPANIRLNDIDVDVVSADVSISNISFVSFGGDSVSGNINLSISPVSTVKKIELDTVSGDIELSLPKELGFTLDFDSVSGDFFCSTAVSKISKHQIIRGNGSTEIEVDTTSGDLIVH